MASDTGPASADQERLLELLYVELRRVAGSLMSKERQQITLQPTALVHEAYLRLVHQPSPTWTGRSHFLKVAARCMRNILVDHARARGAEKRGGHLKPITMDNALIGEQPRELEALMVDQALNRLEQLDPRAARIAEMRLFGGMTIEEIAEALSVSARTVSGDWATARLWLSRELRD